MSTFIKPCLVCSRTPTDVAHIKTKGSGGTLHPENVMPLCREHHTEQHKIGIVTFIKKYPSVFLHLKYLGWEIENHRLIRSRPLTLIM